MLVESAIAAASRAAAGAAGAAGAGLWEGAGGRRPTPRVKRKSDETEKKLNYQPITRLSGRVPPITMRQSKDLNEPDLPESSNLPISEGRLS